MNENQVIKQQLEAAGSFHRQMVKAQLAPSCLNCINFQREPAEKCLKFNTLPPAEVIVFSCGDSWEADIPF